MSIRSRANQWATVSRFCTHRMADYGELIPIELAQARAQLVRELIALVALAVAGLFALSFFCIAIIATALNTPYFLHVSWAIAGMWLLLCVISFIAVQSQKPARAFRVLEDEIRRDLQTIREALK
ncbi:phage holin family protein [Paraburkholderia diazotrophica]|uniref:Putative Holin-X, holin superfamily III n=1 Tax=Paraburkholderia diazotrophica TaxID=667676 RepID=A0A1H7EFY4_9BURK|nr:phage holin family protein [Paraburkholderia diazotrophica]SEK12863.1 Putative Holin-X, holin superfamily III [Paraburkholderia diazotrophica]